MLDPGEVGPGGDPTLLPGLRSLLQTINAAARIEHIHVSATRGGTVHPHASVEALPGVGLAGDRNAIHHDSDICDVTMIEAEMVESLEAYGFSHELSERRLNMSTRGGILIAQ